MCCDLVYVHAHVSVAFMVLTIDFSRQLTNRVSTTSWEAKSKLMMRLNPGSPDFRYDRPGLYNPGW